MVHCHLFVLSLAVAAVSSRSHSLEDEGNQDPIRIKLVPYAPLKHVINEHDDEGTFGLSPSGTNIETLNVVFKNNKITPDALLKPIGRDGEDSPPEPSASRSGDLLCKLGIRCGCGGGRSGDYCKNPDQDDTDNNKPKFKSVSTRDKVGKKYRADPVIIKLLDDLERSLIQNNNQHSHDEADSRDEKVVADHVSLFLKELKNTLDDSEKNVENDQSLCCDNCAKNSNDNKSYLRCCGNCNRDDPDRRDRSDRDSDNFRSDSRPIDRARIFQINDDLDAIVLDVSDVDNVLKLLNNGNNFDNSNSVRDYIRGMAPNTGKKTKSSKYNHRWVSPSLQNVLLQDVNRRRSGQQRRLDPEFGVPFELNVQGLGQVNQ